jgi:hypothetical protein
MSSLGAQRVEECYTVAGICKQLITYAFTQLIVRPTPENLMILAIPTITNRKSGKRIARERIRSSSVYLLVNH